MSVISITTSFISWELSAFNQLYTIKSLFPCPYCRV